MRLVNHFRPTTKLTHSRDSVARNKRDSMKPDDGETATLTAVGSSALLGGNLLKL
jgi:hypothetical protein